jgi:hypothetical protein
MKNEFVTYEQSLALKELGFDELCLAYYDDVELQTPHLSVGRVVKTLSDMQGGYYKLAPLSQQVFRWFREKYGLFGWIEGNEGKRIYMYRIESPIDSDDQLNCFPFKTYEEAENACIDKLISIVKQQAIS